MKTNKSFLIIFLIILPFRICFSQWSVDPSENNILSWNLYVPVIMSDGENGIIVAGQMHWAFPVIYVQRMTVDGRRVYPGNRGLQITDSPDMQWIVDEGKREFEFGMEDGANGCYIGYQIARVAGYTSGPDPSEYYDVGLYIQRLDSNGNRLFGPDGLALMPDEKDSTGYHQRMLYWCADGYGGIYAIFLRQAYNFEPDRDGIYLTRISSHGEILWGPKRLSPDYNRDFIPYLDSNLNLNLYDYPGETFPKTPDKFLKVNSENGEIISEKEIEIGVGKYGFNAFFDYCNSENYSAIFTFRDFRSDTLRIQKLDENGNKLWGNNPVIITYSFGTNLLFETKSDQKGGAYILYDKYRIKIDSLYLVHCNNQGKILWEKAFYCKSDLNIQNESLSVAPNGDVFVLTEKMKYLIKIRNNGEILWQIMVTSRDTIPFYDSWYWGLKADNIGGCIVIWHEIVSKFSGFRAQRVDMNGKPGGPTVNINHSEQIDRKQTKINGIYPNPFNDSVNFEFSLSHSQEVSLKIFNLIGKEVITLISNRLSGGVHSINWQSTDWNGQKVASGVYFLVLQAGSTRVSQKLLIFR